MGIGIESTRTHTLAGTRISCIRQDRQVRSRGLDTVGGTAHSVVAEEPRAYDELLNSLIPPETSQSIDFSGMLPVIPLDPPTRQWVRPARSAASPRPSQRPARVANLSRRLVQCAAYRPLVRIPGKPHDRTREGSGTDRRLPPLWLLGNLVILLAVAGAVLPRLLPVDAAAGCKWHTVVPGDTLGDLGWANHTTALALAHANNIANPNLIYVGEKLCIPTTAAAHSNSGSQGPTSSRPPVLGTAAGVDAFIALALPYARQAHAQTGWPVSVILAQWGLEHGWRIPGFTGYNWGNTGAMPGFPMVPGSDVPGSPAAFAYASTPTAGVQIYVRCAQLVYYRGVTTAARDGADAAARALGASPWDAGHYTDHDAPGSSLLSIMRVYNLYWYDTH